MSSSSQARTKTRKIKAAKAEPRLSRQRKPPKLAVDDWQRGLRQQFGRDQAFELQNLGVEPVFSDYRVHNPASGGTYRVAIRGGQPGDNTCTCQDHATNELGTCKHIEFTLARLAARRGGKTALKQGYTPTFSEVHVHPGPPRTVRWRAGTGCPPRLHGQAAQLFEAGGAMPTDRVLELDAFVAKARALARAAGHELRVQQDALALSAQARDTARRDETLTDLYPKGAKDKGLVKLLKTRLYPYQAEGTLFAARAGRVLLADEMGLGKTVQAIAAAELMARHFGVQRVLVVCPTSLKHQWQREIARFSGRSAQVLQGLRTARQRQYEEDTFCKITNYEAIARDLDLINAWAPDLLIVDEAQRVKNWNTIAARALRRVSAPHAFVLTGTPLENRLEELIAIVQLVDQHRLGPTWRLLHEHQQVDDAGRVVGYRALDRIGATLAPIMLRRRKAEVLTQLPERIDKTLFVPMTAQQRVQHDENGQVVTRIVSRWRKTGYLSDVDQRRLQCALQNMRMACDSTWLLDHETDHGTKAGELMTVLEELFEQPDAKAVVFSQWLGMHDMVIRRLGERGWSHVLFHGGVPAEQRGALVDRFVNDPGCRLFLSTDAGGVGLNLQHAAATVINMDLPWNPAVLEQRIGRVYRLGQQRGVRVVNLVAEASIEHGMLSVLAFKKSLFSGVLDGGEADVFIQGTRLTKFMESVEEVADTVAKLPLDAAPEPAPVPAEGELVREEAVPMSGRDEPPLAEAKSAAEGSPVGRPPAAHTAEGGPAAPAAATSPADPWAILLTAGASLLQSLAQTRQAGGASPLRVEPDPLTGHPSLRLPLPDPAILRPLAQVLGPLLAQVLGETGEHESR